LAPVASKPVEGKQPLQMPWLVAGYADGTVRLFDCNQIDMVLKMHPHAVAVLAICFSADGDNFSLFEPCDVCIDGRRWSLNWRRTRVQLKQIELERSN
jgi:WD40 repeat protein